MSDKPLFCCGSIKSYQPTYLHHQPKFTAFMAWAEYPKTVTAATGETDKTDLEKIKPAFVIQLIQQVNFGPPKSKRFFASVDDTAFIEVSERDLIDANFQKLDSQVKALVSLRGPG